MAAGPCCTELLQGLSSMSAGPSLGCVGQDKSKEQQELDGVRQCQPAPPAISSS